MNIKVCMKISLLVRYGEASPFLLFLFCLKIIIRNISSIWKTNVLHTRHYSVCNYFTTRTQFTLKQPMWMSRQTLKTAYMSVKMLLCRISILQHDINVYVIMVPHLYNSRLSSICECQDKRLKQRIIYGCQEWRHYAKQASFSVTLQCM